MKSNALRVFRRRRTRKMIDKIEAMVERGTGFRGVVGEFYREARYNPEFGAFRRSKYYHAVADLRPYGFDAILHMEQKRYGTHKIELLETGKKGMAELESTIDQIVDQNPSTCRLGRIDLATDISDVHLSWFREHAYIQYKQFICAHGKLVEDEMSEMGKKVFQTLYFGKRPSCVRIYDKVAERLSYFELWKKRETRTAKRSWLEEVAHADPKNRPDLLLPEFPTAAEFLRTELPHAQVAFSSNCPVISFPVVTRVENQFGGRVPEKLRTMAHMKSNVREFNPFDRLKIITSSRVIPGLCDKTPAGDFRFKLIDWLAGMYINQNWNSNGASQMRQMLNRDRNGKRYLEKWAEFIPEDPSQGISSPELFERYQQSISRQLAA